MVDNAVGFFRTSFADTGTVDDTFTDGAATDAFKDGAADSSDSFVSGTANRSPTLDRGTADSGFTVVSTRVGIEAVTTDGAGTEEAFETDTTEAGATFLRTSLTVLTVSHLLNRVAGIRSTDT